MVRIRCGAIVLLAALVAAAPPIRAQDTLSDSAWNADRARRAALRATAQARIDSVASQIDSVIATPDHLALAVGDSSATATFYGQFHWAGRRAGRGDSVRDFVRTIILEPNPYLVVRGGFVVAVAPGRAQIWVKPGRPGRELLPITGPHTIVPITIQ